MNESEQSACCQCVAAAIAQARREERRHFHDACEECNANIHYAKEQARREEREECIEAVRAAGRQVHETPRGPMTSIDVSALFYIDAIRARAQEGT